MSSKEYALLFVLVLFKLIFQLIMFVLIVYGLFLVIL